MGKKHGAVCYNMFTLNVEYVDDVILNPLAIASVYVSWVYTDDLVGLTADLSCVSASY
jgi:hypothetical protein